MSAAWTWPGSRWWRVDLHAHSPKSYDFGSPQDRAQPDWRHWLEAARDAGLDAVAVTDHNCAHAIDALHQAAANVPEAPVVYPGVEITASDGTHLLFVFGPDCTQQHVDELLSKAQIDVDQRGLHEASSPLSVQHLLDLESDKGVVILGAHVNGPKGLLEHDGQQRIKELKHSRLAGADVVPGLPLDATWLDGSRPEVPRVVPQLWSSDSHTFDQAGQRFTWVKMTRPDLQGLRLALLDGRGSLQPATKETPGDPNRHASYAIEKIEVQEAKYLGRPTPFVVEFNPWLNAVIGGRGTGKSTLVDFIRMVFRRGPELPSGGEDSLQDAFAKRMRVPPSRVEEGLLTVHTTVEVTYRKDGERFVLRWNNQGSTEQVFRLDGEVRVPEKGEIRDRFPVRIFGQKQLFELAKYPNALLTVIDDAPEVRGSELASSRKEAENKFLFLRAEARALYGQAADLPTRRASLDDLRRKIEMLQRGSHAEILAEYRRRRLHDENWSRVYTSAREGLESLVKASEALGVRALNEDPVAVADPAVEALRRAQESVASVIETVKTEVAAAVAKARQVLNAIADGGGLAEWRGALAATDEKYRGVTADLAAAGISEPDEYRGLLDRAATLQREISSLEEQSAAAAQRERDAALELQRYRALRADLTAQREAFVAGVSSELTRIQIRANADRGELESFVRNTLGIERFDNDYSQIMERINSPAHGLVAWSFEHLDATVTDMRALLDDPGKQWDGADQRFEAALRRLQPERLDRLALYCPEDEVDVSFRNPGDSPNQWRTLAQGSPGQKTAALLAFVLGYGHEPIILDQPEDDLDSILIYELVVRRIRESKQGRQIIVVTHNPNIVVHGDAELVVSLVPLNGQTHIEFSGGLQEDGARAEVCRVMEGGSVAFETRYRRIMKVDRGTT